MKKIIALVAILSFAVGLNATTKAEIYNSNQTQFDQLKEELQKLNAAETEKQRQALEREQYNKAIKAVFSSKEIINNYSYAVVKDGNIIKLGRANEDDGILFWHEHSPNIQNPPPAYTCRIYDPSWEGIGLDTPCGILKYQMSPTSPYAGTPNLTGNLSLVKDEQENIDMIEAFPTNTLLYYTPGMEVESNYVYFSHCGMTGDPVGVLLRSFQEVSDTLIYSGTIRYGNTSYPRIISPLPPWVYYVAIDYHNYYGPTQYQHDGDDVLTLKTGDYISLLTLHYYEGNTPTVIRYIILKWFRIRVENYYLDGVGIRDNKAEKGVSIGFNNREISITFEDFLNPANNVYELYDISGKLIDKRKLLSHQTTIAMPNVASGVYVVRVYGKNLSVSKKIAYKK